MNFAPALIQALRSARHIAVLTGAGVSAESGLPTFRDAQTGLWSQFRPEDLATPELFSAIPNWCGSGMPGGAAWSSAPNRTPVT
jgi:NAD-dependent deacetylase